MRIMILMGCLSLLTLATGAQSNGRVRSGTPLRWAMNGSVEIMEGDLVKYYGSTDSATNKINRNTSLRSPGNNPNATTFASVQAQCNDNAMLVNWTAIQQYNVDRYEIEQSSDGGRNWTVAGVVPANQTDFGKANYRFDYNRDVSNVLFRIAAVSIGEERLNSATFESPCGTNSYLAASPNPVYSNTTVRIGSSSATKAKLLLVNSSGLVVYSREASLSQGMNTVPLNMSGLQRGYYTLSINWMSGKQELLNIVKY